jgi:hypothetical protein
MTATEVAAFPKLRAKQLVSQHHNPESEVWLSHLLSRTALLLTLLPTTAARKAITPSYHPISMLVMFEVPAQA